MLTMRNAVPKKDLAHFMSAHPTTFTVMMPTIASVPAKAAMEPIGMFAVQKQEGVAHSLAQAVSCTRSHGTMDSHFIASASHAQMLTATHAAIQ
jgi:hypothetical protein